MIRTIVALASLIFLNATSIAADSADDAIRHLLHSTFDKPEARLTVDPVAVTGDHAIAGWSQGDMGGRALLRRRGGQWSLILCSGDGLKSVEALRQAGLAPADASTLSTRLEEAERLLPPDRLALFAKFEGTVMMDESGAHPPASHAGHH